MNQTIVEKYKHVLESFNKENHQHLAGLLDITINYINYKYAEENINFKVTAAYVICNLYEKTGVTKKDVYSQIDEFHKHYTKYFSKFLAGHGGEVNNDNNYKFCEDYIEKNEREK